MIGGVVAAGALLVAAGLANRSPQVPPSSSHSSAGSTGDGVSQAAGEVAGGAADLAPDFTLQSLDGQSISLADYRGEKPVVLDFWASWCPNCRRDMPKLNTWYQEHGDEVEVIGINLQESVSAAQGYVDQAGIVFPIVMDPTGQASRAYGVRYTNYHVLINKDGSVAKLVPGDVSKKDLNTLIANNS